MDGLFRPTQFTHLFHLLHLALALGEPLTATLQSHGR